MIGICRGKIFSKSRKALEFIRVELSENYSNEVDISPVQEANQGDYLLMLTWAVEEASR